MAKTFNTKERLVEVLNQDRKELAGKDASTTDSNETPSSAERVAKNLALIRAYESKKDR
jgi:hypothetical protein